MGDGDCYHPRWVQSGYQANRVRRGKSTKLTSLITHLSAPDTQLYWNSATVSPHQLTNNDTNNISLLLLRCCRCACRGQQLFDLTSHMRDDVDQRSAKRAHSVRYHVLGWPWKRLYPQASELQRCCRRLLCAPLAWDMRCWVPHEVCGEKRWLPRRPWGHVLRETRCVCSPGSDTALF